MTAEPLTPEEEAQWRDALALGLWPSGRHGGSQVVAQLFATLDAARKASPPLDVERLRVAIQQSDLLPDIKRDGFGFVSEVIAEAYAALATPEPDRPPCSLCGHTYTSHLLGVACCDCIGYALATPEPDA